MEKKMMVLRSICKAASAASPSICNRVVRHRLISSRTFFSPSIQAPLNRFPSEYRSLPSIRLGSVRLFSHDVSHMPVITDPDIHHAFKDFMAANWDEIPHSLLKDAKNAVTKNTDDKAGQEILKNVFRAAEASEEFCGILTSLKMEIDDSIGLSGENVKPPTDEIVNALKIIYQRYTTYLDAFGPEETYLRKKVETELGTKMIHLKMRCSGLGAEWGKVTVLGTSGLSGSYVEQRRA